MPPAQAVAYASVAFVALLIAGLGLTSLALDADVVATPGLGLAPGVAGTAAATAGFALALWAGVRRDPSRYGTSAWTAAVAYAAYVAGVWLGALLGGAGAGEAVGAAGDVAVSWFGLIVAAVGFTCGWGGIALVRTRAGRPRWPWEDDADEE